MHRRVQRLACPFHQECSSAMKRHLYHTSRDSREVVVTLSRDRHMADFTLQVSYVDDTLTPIYSSVSDSRARVKSLDYLRAVLTRLGIRIPESMFKAAARDTDRSLEQQIVEHFDDGSTRVTKL